VCEICRAAGPISLRVGSALAFRRSGRGCSTGRHHGAVTRSVAAEHWPWHAPSDEGGAELATHAVHFTLRSRTLGSTHATAPSVAYCAVDLIAPTHNTGSEVCAVDRAPYLGEHSSKMILSRSARSRIPSISPRFPLRNRRCTAAVRRRCVHRHSGPDDVVDLPDACRTTTMELLQIRDRLPAAVALRKPVWPSRSAPAAAGGNQPRDRYPRNKRQAVLYGDSEQNWRRSCRAGRRPCAARRCASAARKRAALSYEARRDAAHGGSVSRRARDGTRPLAGKAVLSPHLHAKICQHYCYLGSR
jgi:hypothetical protein